MFLIIWTFFILDTIKNIIVKIFSVGQMHPMSVVFSMHFVLKSTVISTIFHPLPTQPYGVYAVVNSGFGR